MKPKQESFPLIPKPSNLVLLSSSPFVLPRTATISSNDEHGLQICQLFADQIQRLTSLSLSVVKQQDSNIFLSVSKEDNALKQGDEGYKIDILEAGISIVSCSASGLFYGTQTLLQVITSQFGELTFPALTITDKPRFEFRGVMLDVARHFFSVSDVKRFITLIAHYKFNRLHLGLTNDQGWRIEIKSWPNLTEIGGKSEVGAGKGGFYTQLEYQEIIQFASDHFITVIPEINSPGHINAALASYPELNAKGISPPLYRGIDVGFSSLSLENPITFKFLDDVIREVSAITPGPYIHIGGDEAKSTPHKDYVEFIKRVQAIVSSHSKVPIGWADIAGAELGPTTIAQHWDQRDAVYKKAKQQKRKIILSPANKVYLDMKYDKKCPLGLNWAGLVNVQTSYNWNPTTLLKDLQESDIIGIEACLWTETIRTITDIEFMTFPRAAGIAELAWSTQVSTWEEYEPRLIANQKHMELLGINFFRWLQ